MWLFLLIPAFPTGRLNSSERKQPSLATVSALSLATASIFFELSSRKGYLKTVKIYNDHKSKPSPIDLNLGITTSGGLGLNMKF